jgi:hypothetical protein
MSANKAAGTNTQPNPDAKAGQTQAKVKRRHTGQAKRSMQRRIGPVTSMLPTDAPTAAKSAAAQEANARSRLANGHTQRATPEMNLEAFGPVHSVCTSNALALEERGLAKTAVQGAAQIHERLGVLIEVAALSVVAVASASRLDDAAFLSKRRDAILRVAPGIHNTAFRSKFGLNEPVRANLPATLKQAARMLLAGKKAMPESRAAKLITLNDEKRLRAIVQSIQATETAQKKAKQSGTARITERDILNCALEMFFDDFAASIGLVLENDEVARLQALELVPRRTERRAEDTQGAGSGAGGSTPGAAQTSSGAESAPATV